VRVDGVTNATGAGNRTMSISTSSDTVVLKAPFTLT
jgi:hypothetical protein